MPQDISFKTKYLELRNKYMEDVDMAFRLGFEQGAQQAQQQQALDAQAQAQQMQHEENMAEAQGNEAGGESSGGPEAPEPGNEQTGSDETKPLPDHGSELDQHLDKLQGMLGGSENPEVQKSLNAIVSLRKAEKFAADMKKSDHAIKGIVKALHKPAFKMGTQAQHNMNSTAKQAVSMQHKIVDDIMKAWKAEEAKAGKDIMDVLNVENIVKG